MRQHKDIDKAGTTEYVAFLRGEPGPEDDFHQPILHKTNPVGSLDAAKKAAADALVNYPNAVTAEVDKTVWSETYVFVHDGEEILWIDEDTDNVDFGDCDNSEIHWEQHA